MDYLDSIISTTINSFDFGLILVINVFTYCLIKIVEETKHDVISKLVKRIITIFSAIVVGLIYYFVDPENSKLILNSVLISPVSWDWIFKPIFNKLKCDYRDGSNCVSK